VVRHVVQQVLHGDVAGRVHVHPGHPPLGALGLQSGGGVRLGLLGYIDQGKRDLPFQLSSKGTYLANNHEVKFGFEYTTKKWTEFYGPSGGQTWYVYLHNGDGSGFPTTNVNDYAYWRVDWLQNPNVDNKGTYSALFAQDKWSITPYVTLSYGLRWEQDQLQPKNGQHWSVSDLSPRIGVNWDFARNGKSKFYASWGDYFERPPLAATNEMDSGHASYENRYYAGSKYQSITYSSTPAYVFGGTTNQSVQESIAGVAYELKPDLTLDVRGTWRQIGHVLEDAGYIDPQGNLSYLLYNPGGGQYPAVFGAWAHQQLADGAPFDYELPARPIRNYSAYTLTLLKRFSNHWFLNGSYTYALLKGNYGGGRGYYGGDMNITEAFDIPESALNKNTYGWLAQDIRSQVKVQTSYTFDFGLVLGANLTFRTGLPYNAYTPYPYYESFYGNIYYTPLGSQRLPSVWSLDLHAEYDFKIYKSALAIFLDVFNTTNNQGITSVYETRWKQPDYMTQILNGSWYANAANLDPNYGKSTSRQSPRNARVGIKWSF